MQLINRLCAPQAERADGTSYLAPLRRYANAVATDMRLSYRGTLTNGTLKAGNAISNEPEVSRQLECTRPAGCLCTCCMEAHWAGVSLASRSGCIGALLSCCLQPSILALLGFLSTCAWARMPGELSVAQYLHACLILSMHSHCVLLHRSGSSSLAMAASGPRWV